MNWRTQAAFDLCLTILCHAPDRNPRRPTASHDASVDQRASPYHEPMPTVGTAALGPHLARDSTKNSNEAINLGLCPHPAPLRR
jgi:hypothetical protein